MLRARSVTIPASPVTDPKAYRLFLLGRYWNSQASEESYGRAVETSSVPPPSIPVSCRPRRCSPSPTGITRGRRGEEQLRLRRASREAAERAVKLDPSSAWGYTARAAIPADGRPRLEGRPGRPRPGHDPRSIEPVRPEHARALPGQRRPDVRGRGSAAERRGAGIR